MARKSTQGQLNVDTGRVERRQVKRPKPGDFDITIIDTPWKRIKRNLIG